MKYYVPFPCLCVVRLLGGAKFNFRELSSNTYYAIASAWV